ncbi:MAG: terminase small subunit [Georgenia sp.]
MDALLACLTARQATFAREYMADLDATKAAKRAGYSVKTAGKQGWQLLGNPRIAAAVAALQAARAARLDVTADQVLRQWWAIATADPNELIDLRRTCCRYCHGEGHRQQRTQAELEDALAQHERVTAKWKDADGPVPAFDMAGGSGYDARLAPHPECPECFGDGVAQVFPKDTRHLSPAARLLYAGVKQTKDGLEIKMRDQDGALANVAKHLGMFTDTAATTPEQTRDTGVLRTPAPVTAEEWSAVAQQQQDGLRARTRDAAA